MRYILRFGEWRRRFLLAIRLYRGPLRIKMLRKARKRRRHTTPAVLVSVSFVKSTPGEVESDWVLPQEAIIPFVPLDLSALI